MSRIWIRCLGLLFPAGLSAAPLAEPPLAIARATIVSEDCVSVNADGEPWQECGIQAFDMDEAGSRILTVTATGLVQLWNENGAELGRIDWPDQPSGASGYPSAHVAIAGAYGVAVTHQNQLVVFDLASGRVLAQRVLDAMLVGKLARFGRDRMLVDFRDRDWNVRAGEIVLPSGDIQQLPGLTDLMRAGPSYWISRARPPFTLHRAGAVPTEVALERSCMPLDDRYCVWRDIPGSRVHLLDVVDVSWRSYDLGRTLHGVDSLDVVRSGGGFFAVICGPGTGGYPGMRPCSLRDLGRERDLHTFQASAVHAVAGVGPGGAPEIRMMISVASRRKAIALSTEGIVRTIDPTGQAGLTAPNSGVVVPAEQANASYLLDREGHRTVRLPFRAQTCGNGWPTWTSGCRSSANGGKWLVPTNVLPDDQQDVKIHLTLYELPDA